MAAIHHTNGERKWAYDWKLNVGRLYQALDEAPDNGFTVVDIKKARNTCLHSNDHEATYRTKNNDTSCTGCPTLLPLTAMVYLEVNLWPREMDAPFPQRVHDRNISIILFCLFVGLLCLASPSFAEWKMTGESNVYYTDDAALFSATRRLARHQDPTQPVIDRKLANQGNDVVIEPAAQIEKTFLLMGRQTQLAVRGQGFLFTDNTQFNHGSLGVQANHHLTPSTIVGLRYFFGPELFLGKNEVRPVEEGGGDPPQLKDESVTTHYWAGGVAQEIPGVDDARLVLYGRYGLREYDKPFTQRNTRFWTIGTHVEWPLTKKIEVAFGYHYERGLAEGRKQPELQDDLSYFNHFVTGELEFEITESLDVELALHYEFNGWTTGIPGDERRGEHENIVQGDIALRYKVNEAFHCTAGFQGAHRKESFEEGLKNFNTWVGAKLVF